MVMNVAVELISTTQAMAARGIDPAGLGNVSARTSTGMLITPHGIDYSRLTPDDIVAMDFDASWFATNNLRPSTAWRLHLDILRHRSDVNALVQVHSTYSSALAALGEGIEPFSYLVVAAGGRDIRCGAYAPIGSQDLSENALIALEGRYACLLANHGLITLGADLPGALGLAIRVEELARQYLTAKTVGEPNLLTDEQVAAEIERLKAPPGYGPGSIRPDAKILNFDR